MAIGLRKIEALKAKVIGLLAITNTRQIHVMLFPSQTKISHSGELKLEHTIS